MEDLFKDKLIILYGEEKGKEVGERLKNIINEAKSKIICENRSMWDEKDIFLITYADSFQEANARSLITLKKFLDFCLKDVIDNVHILPFYPYSSDRGFSITDYYQVKKEFGSWNDIEEIGKHYRLMADLVLNHVSVKHEWFQKFLAGDPKYENYFIWFKKEEIPYEALKKVYRPRETPLLTPFKTAKGEKWIWTTFSVENFSDQVDLNYKNPEVLLEIVKIILFLLQKGIRIFRFDSIPFIWKEIGSDCKNLAKTHTIVCLFRNFIDLVCPTAMIIAQSSVSFKENVSYFGSEDKEAHLIYNFALPVLVLNAFYNQSNHHLNEMVSQMVNKAEDCSYFNILAVHDGIGVNGAKDFLSESEFNNLYNEIEKRAGKLSYRNLPDGSKTVVELNITWWSAINNPSSSFSTNESFELELSKFITSLAILFALKGLPALYYLSLFGQENDLDLFEKTGIKRDINRTNLNLKSLDFRLKKSSSKEARIFDAIVNLIKIRKSLKVFHPNARQEVLSLDERVFTLLRGEKEKQILALHNISDDKVEIKYAGRIFNLEPYSFIWQEL